MMVLVFFFKVFAIVYIIIYALKIANTVWPSSSTLTVSDMVLLTFGWSGFITGVYCWFFMG